MLKDADWVWVRDWVGRIVFAVFPLSAFGYLSVSPVIRPGGVIAALPAALLFALAVSVPAALLAGGLLALHSARAGARRQD